MSDYFKSELSNFQSTAQDFKQDIRRYIDDATFGSGRLYNPANWDSLVHYWPFDSDESDDIGSADWTVDGSPTRVSAVGGTQGLSFDGSDDRLNQSLTAPSSGNISVSLWCSFDSVGTDFISALSDANDTVNSKTALGYRGDVDELSAALNTDSSSANITSGIQPSENTKYHLVFTYDGSQFEFFINNSSQGTVSLSGSASFLDNNIWIAYTPGVQSYDSFNYIDEIMIFDSGLSASEVDTLYQAGV